MASRPELRLEAEKGLQELETLTGQSIPLKSREDAIRSLEFFIHLKEERVRGKELGQNGKRNST